jgi:putative Mg2+ transporter-C (MgtC) family protein
MPLTLTWHDIAIRLALSVVAGTLIGLDRGEHGRPAGLRTTLLVCLAAAVAMIQTNLLLATKGRPTDSFIMLDLMRLPLGILTGMGFIGGGAILRRDGFVLGVTTAATLWFVTVIGLCFGGGSLRLESRRLRWDCWCSPACAGSTTP